MVWAITGENVVQHEQAHVPMLGKQPGHAEHTQSGTAPARYLERRITSYPELAPLGWTKSSIRRLRLQVAHRFHLRRGGKVVEPSTLFGNMADTRPREVVGEQRQTVGCQHAQHADPTFR